jgi:hypothetical protein
MSRVERITFHDNRRKRKVLLEDVKDGFESFASITRSLVGDEVDREGVATGTRHVIVEVNVIDRTLFVTDRMTGVLVPDGTATQQKGWLWPVDADLVHWFRRGRHYGRVETRSACGRWTPDSGDNTWLEARFIAEYRRDGLLCRRCADAAARDAAKPLPTAASPL